MSTGALVSYLQRSRDALEATMSWPALPAVDDAIDSIDAAIGHARPLLVCGNGGSASDAMHIAGELVGRFLRERKAINCICLSCNPAVVTAWANDYSYDTVFARQVDAHGQSGGVLLGISTSGNSANVARAFETARSLGLRTIALTGQGGGALARLADILIDVPSQSTPIIQQLHICIYHYICEQLEARWARRE